MKTFNFDYNRGVFVNAAGGVIGIVPELVYGEQAEWQLALKTASNTPYPLTGVASFTAAVGTVETIVAATNSGITATASTGLVNVPLDCFTSEFQQVVAGQANGVFAAFELSGFDASGDKVLYLRFAVELRNEINTSGLSPSMEQKILETVSSGGYTTSGAATDIAREVMSSGGGMPSGAIIENQSFSTTVGDYNITFSDGGLEIAEAGGGVTISATSGQVFVSTFDEITEAGADMVIAPNGITANGSAITQASSAFAGTSLGIGTLEGGVKYICQSALTALSIGSAAPGCNAAFFFTVASGAVVTLPGSLPFFGEYPNSSGASYCLAINGDMAVCAPAVSAGV